MTATSMMTSKDRRRAAGGGGGGRMRPTARVVAPLAIAWLAAAGAAAADDAPSFEKDIQPLLERRCAACHGAEKKSAGLRLDSHARLLAGTRKGAVIVPGKSGDSRLIALVRAAGEERMPPPDEGEALSPEEIASLARWIDAGAIGPATGAPLPEADAAPEAVTLEALPPDIRPVLDLAGDAAGKWLAVARGARVHVHAIADGAVSPQPAATLRGHEDLVQALAFSPDGSLLATAGFRRVVLYDTATWLEARRLDPHADRVLGLAFSPDGALLAAAGGEPAVSAEVRLWKTASGELVKTIEGGHSDTIFSVAFSPDATRLATAAADRVVAVIEIESGKRVLALEGHTHHVLAARFSPDGKRLYSASADGKIKSWDLEAGAKLKDWNGHGKAVLGLEVSADGKTIVSVSGDRSLRIWDPEGRQVRSHGEAQDYLYAVTFCGSGQLVAAAGRDRKTRVYSLSDNKLIATIDEPAEE